MADSNSKQAPLCYVTGATGFVGSHLAEMLLAQGKRVRVLVRDAKRLPPSLNAETKNLEIITGTLNDDYQELAKGFEGVDYVYHVAGLIGALRQIDFDTVNVHGTTNLLRAVKEAGTQLKRFLLVSSLAAFGPADDLGRPRAESDDDNPRPRTMYGKSKLAGEKRAWEFCRDNDIPLTVIRPPAVYGPRDKGILEFFKFMGKGIEVGIGGQKKYLDLIHGRDLSRGMILAAEADKAVGQAYYLTDGGGHEMRDLMKVMREVVKPKKTRTLIAPVFVVKVVAKFNDMVQAFTGKMRLPNSDKLGELMPSSWTCNPDKAREDFGFVCEIPLRDGLKETGDWYEAKGWIKVKR